MMAAHKKGQSTGGEVITVFVFFVDAVVSVASTTMIICELSKDCSCACSLVLYRFVTKCHKVPQTSIVKKITVQNS